MADTKTTKTNSAGVRRREFLATGADPIQLALAMVFILLAGLQLSQLPLSGVPDRLRPPLRGPPVIA